MKRELNQDATRNEVEFAIKNLKRPFLKRILRLLDKTPVSKKRAELQEQVLTHTNEEIVGAYNEVLSNRKQTFEVIKDIVINIITKLLQRPNPA